MSEPRPTRDSACILWSTVLFTRMGFAEEARNNILALDRAGVPVLANPFSWGPWEIPPESPAARRLEELIAIEAPDRFVHVMHLTPTHFVRHPAALWHVGRTMSETETLSPAWVPKCNEMDEVWVPGEFGIEALARSGVEAGKLHAVPEGVDPEAYAPEVRPLELEGAVGFVFLSVFSWGLRKGWDVLVRAYLEEFDADEDVTLVLKVAPLDPRMVPQLDVYVRRELNRDPARSARILVLDINLAPEEMPRLYRAADAYVMPSRGEGWGRPYMEAMATGLPTIGTRWGGNLEFMSDENAYLVDCDVVDVSEAAYTEVPPYRGLRWAEPSVEHLRALMRQVFEHREEARGTGERARADVLSHWTWDHVVSAIRERLQDLESSLSRRGPGAIAVSEPPAGAETEPDEALAAYKRGKAHREAGRVEEAEADLKRALLLLRDWQAVELPGWVDDAYLTMAELLLEGGRFSEAARYARSAIQTGSAEAHGTFAEALLRLGLHRTAERATELGGTQPRSESRVT